MADPSAQKCSGYLSWKLPPYLGKTRHKRWTRGSREGGSGVVAITLEEGRFNLGGLGLPKAVKHYSVGKVGIARTRV